MSAVPVEASRQNALLIVLGLVVVAAIVGLFWRLGPEHRAPAVGPATATAAPTEQRRSAPATTERAPPTLAVEPELDPDPDTEAPPSEGTPPLAQLLASLPDELLAIATPCYTGEYRPDNSGQRVTFRYTVSFDDEWASIEDVILLASDMDDDELARCVLDKVRGSRFEAPGARRHVTRQQLSISIADLSR
jgi:hypothetical protein